VKIASTPMETQKPLLRDKDGEEVDIHMYRSMIGSLMYLTSSRPDIMFVVCACARYQVNLKVSHLHAVKRIFSLDRKSTTRGYQFLGCKLISWQCKKQIVVGNSTTEAEKSKEKYYIVNGKAFWNGIGVNTESIVRRDLQLEDAESIDCLPNSTIFEELTRMGYEKISQKLTFYKAFFSPQWKFLIHTILQCLSSKTTAWNEFSSTMASPSGPTNIVANEVVHKELGDSLVRAATTASSLEAEQDSGNITKTRSKATPNESCSLGTNSGGGPRCQETMGDTIAQTRFKNVSKHSNDSLLAREKTKTNQQNEIASLKRRVKNLKQKKRSRTHGLKRLYKVDMSRRVVSSGDEEDLDDVDNEIFDVDTLTNDEVFTKQEVAAKGDVIEEPSIPVSAASASIRVSAATTTTTIPTPRKGIVFTELGTPIITRSSQQPSQTKVQDKGKGKMVVLASKY
ncbi:hypothetical protein Tco_0888097, partial [Tanacetum coccineum]